MQPFYVDLVQLGKNIDKLRDLILAAVRNAIRKAPHTVIADLLRQALVLNCQILNLVPPHASTGRCQNIELGQLNPLLRTVVSFYRELMHLAAGQTDNAQIQQWFQQHGLATLHMLHRQMLDLLGHGPAADSQSNLN